jgi:hydroxyacylglutathione hydrolase
MSIGTHDVATIVSDAPWSQNCYLITAPADQTIMIVDPGAESPELHDVLRESGFRPTLMLVTHAHPDHIGAAAALCEELDLDCQVSIDDARLLRHAPAYSAAFGHVRMTPPRRVRYIDAAADIRFGDERVRIHAVPGHTPGSLAFELGSMATTGDALFREHTTRTDLPGGDRATMIGSVDRLLAALPDDTALLAGHGRPWTAGEAKEWWTANGRTTPGAAVG